jgi:hypothetical protein
MTTINEAKTYPDGRMNVLPAIEATAIPAINGNRSLTNGY